MPAVSVKRTLIRETPCASLSRFEHPPEATQLDSDEEPARSFQIGFVEHGWFQLCARRQRWLLGAGRAFISRPGECYTYKHPPKLVPDTCIALTFRLTKANAEELARAFRRIPLVLSPSNRLAFLAWRIRGVESGDDSLRLETLAYELLAAAAAQNGAMHLYRPNQLGWYAKRICAARELLDTEFAVQHSLESIAANVAMSPFLFARIFRELTGTPPHQYLVGVRLQRACLMIEQGASVTDTCYGVGFNNLSHFIRSFRARFGCTPSAIKRRARRAQSAA
jgi:AraC-like DNA-binding protein